MAETKTPAQLLAEAAKRAAAVRAASAAAAAALKPAPGSKS